jgi:pilus assembly protein Flp/PilA
MIAFWTRFQRHIQGQDLVEYALAAGMVAVAAVACLPGLTSVVSNVFAKIASVINSSVT